MNPGSRSSLRISPTVIVGNLWGRNFGDDLMLLGLLPRMRTSEVHILCQHGSEGLIELGLNAEEFSLSRYLYLVRDSERVLVPGGTHLQYVRGGSAKAQYRVLAGWLILTVLARMAGSRPHMEAVGIGPLHTAVSRLLVRLICLLHETITVRDKASQETLSTWGISAVQTEDLALAELRRWRAIAPVAENARYGAYVLAAPAFARFETRWWVHNVMALCESANVRRVKFFASGRQSGGDDLEAIAAIKEYLPDTVHVDEPFAYEGDVDAALRIIAGATAVVAARYHVVAAARALGKPVVADEYHPKVSDAMRIEPL